MTTSLRNLVLGAAALAVAIGTAGCGLTPTPVDTAAPVVDPHP